MKPFEIYVFRINYRGCKDPRPCMIVEGAIAGWVKVLPMSSQWDTFNAVEHLEIRHDYDSTAFDASGLSRDCYLDGEIHEVAVDSVLDPDPLNCSPIGTMTGGLKRRIEDWIGPL